MAEYQDKCVDSIEILLFAAVGRDYAFSIDRQRLIEVGVGAEPSPPVLLPPYRLSPSLFPFPFPFPPLTVVLKKDQARRRLKKVRVLKVDEIDY